MQKRTTKPAEITAESLKLEMPAAGDKAGGLPPVDPTEIKPPVVMAAAAPHAHADIGNWVAIYWRGVPMWRHKRTGQTMHKRTEVLKNRNLK